MAEIRVKETGTIKLFESDNTSSVTIASPASLGADRTVTLPDASVTLASGTMLATDGSGASLTALNASELGSGTVPTARLGSGTASSTTILYGDQTYKTEPSGGLGVGTLWGQTTANTTSAYLTANWQQCAQSGVGNFGSAMTESSGVFTFPSTGYWFLTFKLASNEASGESTHYVNNRIDITVNDSSYTPLTGGTSHFASSTQAAIRYSTAYCSSIFDVTDVSQCKCKFMFEFAGTIEMIGNTVDYPTQVSFMRLADT